jgi:hypothetical protein
LIDFSLLTVLSELGLQPTEILIVAMLWQNMRNCNVLMEKLIQKVNELEIKITRLEELAPTAQ